MTDTPAHTVASLAAALSARVEGDGTLPIDAPAEPSAAGPRHLALAMSEKYVGGLAEGSAKAAILWDGADWRALGLEAAIFVPRPRYAMAHLTAAMDPGPDIADGIHSLAVIDPSAEIGAGAAIGPFVTIGAGARIGPGARIAAHVSIGAGAVIGADCVILEGVRIGHHVRIGDRFRAHGNAVIGADGFSYVTPEKSGVETARESLGTETARVAQSWTRIHSLGSVEIADDVEIGALASIDRGTIRATMIGRGTKIDNMVHVGHNGIIGEDCLLCGQVGMAGSVTVGNRVVLGGKVGVVDNLFIGDDVVAGGATVITVNVPAGRVIWGYPAVKMDTQIEINKGMRRLPRLYRDVAEIKKALQNRGDGA